MKVVIDIPSKLFEEVKALHEDGSLQSDVWIAVAQGKPLEDEPLKVYEFKGCDNCELERPHGEWILQYRAGGDEFYTCSLCERVIEIDYPQTLKDFPFCHCGADMRGSTNEG